MRIALYSGFEIDALVARLATAVKKYSRYDKK
jgi:hypothetical protein